MSIFGFSSKKEVKEKERLARESGRNQVLRSQQNDLENLAKGSQVRFAVPYFDVFDPRYPEFGVPVSVHGMIIYAIDDIDKFNQINKTEMQSDSSFEIKLKGQLTKYVKEVVINAPLDNQIPVIQIERKIIEIGNLIQHMVTPQIEKFFGINVRSIDITEIIIDKSSLGYRDLRAVTTDLEKEKWQTVSNLNLEAMRRQQNMSLSGQETLQQIQLENQRENMRIAREENQRVARLQTEANFLTAHQANLNAHGTTSGGGMFSGFQSQPSMPSMDETPPLNPQVQYMVGVNGQPAGPFDWNQLQQMVQDGQLTLHSQVWKQGMQAWCEAGQIQELSPLFTGQISAMKGMPPMI